MVFPGIWFIFGGQNRVPYNREPVYLITREITYYHPLPVAGDPGCGALPLRPAHPGPCPQVASQFTYGSDSDGKGCVEISKS